MTLEDLKPWETNPDEWKNEPELYELEWNPEPWKIYWWQIEAEGYGYERK